MGPLVSPVGVLASPLGVLASPLEVLATPVGVLATPLGVLATLAGVLATPVGGGVVYLSNQRFGLQGHRWEWGKWLPLTLWALCSWAMRPCPRFWARPVWPCSPLFPLCVAMQALIPSVWPRRHLLPPAWPDPTPIPPTFPISPSCSLSPTVPAPPHRETLWNRPPQPRAHRPWRTLPGSSQTLLDPAGPSWAPLWALGLLFTPPWALGPYGPFPKAVTVSGVW